MAKDSTLYVRRAIIAHMKADEAINDVVPERSIYPPQRPPDPPRPFIAYGVPITAPFQASCLDGSAVTVAVHAYTKTEGEGDATIGGEDAATDINGRVATSLDGAALDLEPFGCPYPATAHVIWTGSQVMLDGAEADHFHGFATFAISVSS